MFKIHITEADSPPYTIAIDGDSATIGRTDANDVTLALPYVSGAHARILHGFVVMDLGSSNGTYIDGRRIRPNEPVLVGTHRLTVGNQGLELRLEADPGEAAGAEEPAYGTGTLLLDAPISAGPPPAPAPAPRAETVSTSTPPAPVSAGDSELADSLKRENADLRRRLETLKADIEGSAKSDGESVQARLSADRLREVQKQNEELRLQLGTTRAELEGAKATAGSAGPAEEGASELERTVERLTAELERVREESSMPASELFAKLQADNGRLRERVAELDARPAPVAAPAPESAEPEAAKPVSELFLRLQRDNAELRRELEQARASRPAGDGAEAHSELFVTLREENDKLTQRVAELDRAVLESAGARQVPAQRIGSEGDSRALLTALAQNDVEGVNTPDDAPVEDLVLTEAFRFLRQAERVTTRLAGISIGIYSPHTNLPNTEGSLRELTLDLLADPDEPARRTALLDYLKALRLWFVGGLQGRKTAAERFADQLKRDLGEQALAGKEPLSPFAKLPGQREAELWRRAQAHLATLTPEHLERQLDDLAGSATREFVEHEEPGA